MTRGGLGGHGGPRAPGAVAEFSRTGAFGRPVLGRSAQNAGYKLYPLYGWSTVDGVGGCGLSNSHSFQLQMVCDQCRAGKELGAELRREDTE